MCECGNVKMMESHLRRCLVFPSYLKYHSILAKQGSQQPGNGEQLNQLLVLPTIH